MEENSPQKSGFKTCLERTRAEQTASTMSEELLSSTLSALIYIPSQISLQLIILMSFGWYWSILYAPFLKAVCPSVNRLEAIKGHLFWLLQRPNHFQAANMWQNQLKACQVQDLFFLKSCGVCFLSLLPEGLRTLQDTKAEIQHAVISSSYCLLVQTEVFMNSDCFVQTSS